jgi:hypothetical protein
MTWRCALRAAFAGPEQDLSSTGLEPEKDQEHMSEQEQDDDGDVDQSGSRTLPLILKVPGGD